ncbi:MAG: trypsin-like peptidase domain-containing protein [Deltaproteobacteria bacterium]|nr:trypsin-like peptidase domain-containing protein [Deltaproteobacteria bacterium]
MTQISSAAAAALLAWMSGATATPAPASQPLPAAPAAVPASKGSPASPEAALADRAAVERLLGTHVRSSARSPEAAGLKPRAARIPKAKGDVVQVYKKVAPATVIVRSRNGFGTGVIIDPSGFILTNHHVVADGEWEGMRLKVMVELGSLSEDGIMEKQAKPYIAYVHRTDKLLDLAVIKLVEGPANLPAVTVAKKDPVPGEAVASLGNGGVGLLWAIKSGEVASIGRLATHLAIVAARECRGATCPTSAEEDDIKGLFERTVPGLVIQSTCTISPGDSGGPLVNQAGELVGLNAFLRTAGDAPVTANFHVHVAEVRRFVSAVPAQPASLFPDPWAEAKGFPRLADADSDGSLDTLSAGEVLLYDLDQDSGADGARISPLEVLRKRSFDAEAAVLSAEERTYAFFDLDNDQHFERVVVQEGATSVAYQLAKDGTSTELPKAEGNAYLAAAAFSDPAMLKRFKVIAGEQLGLPEDPDVALVVPDLYSGRFALPSDADHDGKPDTLYVASPASKILLIDADQGVLGKKGPREAMQAYLEHKAGVDLAVFARGNKAWALYDRNGDGLLDLMLVSLDMRTGATGAAYTLVDGKVGEPAPEHVGLRLLRPRLLPTAAAVKRAMASLKVHVDGLLIATDESYGALPNPLLEEGEADFAGVELEGYEQAVVAIEGDESLAVLMDLDRDSFKAARAPADLNEFVAQGKFKAELALLTLGKASWALYDTDRDHRWDLVLYAPAGTEVTQAFQVNKQGKISVAPKLVAGKLLRWSVFPTPMHKSTQALLGALAQAAALEE